MTPLVLVAFLTASGGAQSAHAQTIPSGCTREALQGLVDRYFAALEAHDPFRLPLAVNVRTTENGVATAVGEGIWRTAGKALLKRSLIDTRKCGTLTNAVVEEPFSARSLAPLPRAGTQDARSVPAEGTPRPILFGIRLRVEDGKISEMEAIIARESEFAFNAEGALATKDQDWGSILPPAQRSSRLAMMAAADDYFDMFAAEPRVHTPFASPCDRWENGMFSTAGVGSTLPGEDGKTTKLPAHDCSPKGLVIANHGPRRFLVDEEAGLVVALVHFAGALPDLHMFKMRNGKVELIHAVVGAAAPSMGWPPEPACRD